MTSLATIFSPDELASMTRPLSEALAPPAAYYTSQALYEL